ncbi:tRNA (adenosine(37)-N6)-threonylcarbamoyltransferase complex ATPase subunit type 1 TsaE [Vulgatibacter incomptus]|uniref:tRNA threonylcarbamoyladenosine biosynthesis protein TsaE n=1 Tax=Vulgatibacter incomptus TaxID=1391653 RepID=A0A0K1PDM6_9BACT|nr:tRNA (adenosine(37)-N6)-threonylcarbamoyltransferase complex ATPase subunit type 1 TsaE [Vulgatibacter incomptus]AKU91625.1 hypothetical protein AKJ08_2012 [Vulgatibacter incomptus]
MTVNLEGSARTRALGRRIADLLRPGDFVGLVGELGAGKTLLSRSICEALGVPRERIASPTFAIVHPYDGGRIPIHHADLYRVEDYDELYATGFLDLVSEGSALIVEWIDRIPEAAPAEWLRIELEHVSPQARSARITGFGPRGEELARALAPS